MSVKNKKVVEIFKWINLSKWFIYASYSNGVYWRMQCDIANLLKNWFSICCCVFFPSNFLFAFMWVKSGLKRNTQPRKCKHERQLTRCSEPSMQNLYLHLEYIAKSYVLAFYEFIYVRLSLIAPTRLTCTYQFIYFNHNRCNPL